MRLDLHNNIDTEVILKAIGIKEEDIPRLRGVGIDDGKILIHTRTGGGNREYYESENEALRANPYFLHDEDDDFDCTYANFWYRIPPEHADLADREDKARKAALGDASLAIPAMFGDQSAIAELHKRIREAQEASQ
jgi:hypothetical protein